MEINKENPQTPETRRPLADRLNGWWLEQNAWKALNGGCVISADTRATLLLLRENVLPRREDLPDLIRRSVEGRDRGKRTLETIWSEKIAEGATHVGVLEGRFHFFRGEDVLPEDNDDLRIPVMPAVLRFRAVEKARIAALTHRKEVRFRDENSLPAYAGAGADVGADAIAAPAATDLPAAPELQTGPGNIAPGDSALA